MSFRWQARGRTDRQQSAEDGVASLSLACQADTSSNINSQTSSRAAAPKALLVCFLSKIIRCVSCRICFTAPAGCLSSQKQRGLRSLYIRACGHYALHPQSHSPPAARILRMFDPCTYVLHGLVSHCTLAAFPLFSSFSLAYPPCFFSCSFSSFFYHFTSMGFYPLSAAIFDFPPARPDKPSLLPTVNV